MKILVVTQYFYPETFRVNTLCRELVKRGHEVTVLTGYPQYPQGRIYDGYSFKKPYDKEWEGVKIQRVKMLPRGRTPIGLLLNCWTFVQEGKKWVRTCREKFDAVYVFEVSPVTVGLPALAYKKKFGTPIFFNVQDLWPENVEVVLGIRTPLVIGPINRIVDRIYAGSDKILCSSESFVENISSRGVPREKLVFWPQFCSEPNLLRMKKPDVYREEFFNIVFAGNIGNAQGLDLLVAAATQLKDTNVRWYLVGDGRARARLEEKVNELDLTQQITFIGKVSEEEANRYIHFADCAYLSFQNNKLFDMTLPAKLQSYMACGTPILAAAGGESRRIVEVSGAGIACDQNEESLAESVREMASASNRREMAQRARNYYENHFTLDILVKQLENMMKERCISNE